jgi:putative endonuclease
VGRLCLLPSIREPPTREGCTVRRPSTSIELRTFNTHERNRSEFRTARSVRLLPLMHGVEKRIVYILRSEADARHHYVGITNDLRARLDWHNAGPAGHTIRHRPWSVVVSMEFPTEQAARRFEKYLKSGSGRAFACRHFGAPACRADGAGVSADSDEFVG